MDQRCATLPFLESISFDRKWDGVTPSAAGNGSRYLYLKAITDYAISPNNRVWAALGIAVHGGLSIHEYTKNVLSEEKLSDGKMRGIADVLEHDEFKPGFYVLTDYKTWGSYKAAKAMGIISETIEETILDENNKPVLLKSGKNEGQPKTKQKKIITQDNSQIDMRSEELQLNRYRIFFEKMTFPISRINIQIISRDGGTYIAKNRGITRNLYVIPVKRLQNKIVLDFYKNLSDEVTKAFANGYARKCNAWESWDRRKCEGGYCEVVEACKAMSEKHNEKWGII
ncbi:MAG: hypothetical protein ACYSR0_09535 [Planctomycetota bacterium]|jgi:hypothetical protein